MFKNKNIILFCMSTILLFGFLYSGKYSFKPKPTKAVVPIALKDSKEDGGIGFEEIAESMRLFVEKEHLLIEGAAAVAVAGFLKQKNDYRDQKVVIIICGGNIGLETLKKIL